MKTKLFLALGLLCLSLLINTATPKDAWASCSGENCGCEYYMNECMANCQQEPPESYAGCTYGCRQEYRACAIACCEPF
jgi:hypothetical protein